MFNAKYLQFSQRAFLLRFLIDETLSSTLIRNHISTDNCDSKRNFLGQDSAVRLYWVLGRPERLFVSGPHKEGEESSDSSSSREFDSWNCYESDSEIEALVKWLRDDDERENKLKATIIDWQRNKSNDQNGQVDLQIKNLRSPIYSTNARAELEKKFGSFVGAVMDGGEGRIVHERKLYRCDCLELVGSTRQHCFTCHLTFISDEVHRCDGPLELKEAGDTIEKQLSLTNGLVESNRNPSSVPEDSTQDNNAAFFVNHGVESNVQSTDAANESPCEADRSNPEGITGKSPPSSSRPSVGRASEILSHLKIILLDIEAALPTKAFRLSRADADRVRCWRVFLKSAQSIFEVSFCSLLSLIILLFERQSFILKNNTRLDQKMIKQHSQKREKSYNVEPKVYTTNTTKNYTRQQTS